MFHLHDLLSKESKWVYPGKIVRQDHIKTSRKKRHSQLNCFYLCSSCWKMRVDKTILPESTHCEGRDSE